MKRTDIAELESGLRDLLGLVQEGEAVTPRTGMLSAPAPASAEPTPSSPLDSIDALQSLLDDRQLTR